MKYVLIVFSATGLEIARLAFDTPVKAAAEWMMRVTRGQKAQLIVEE